VQWRARRDAVWHAFSRWSATPVGIVTLLTLLTALSALLRWDGRHQWFWI
jgi:hypothetical protein